MTVTPSLTTTSPSSTTTSPSLTTTPPSSTTVYKKTTDESSDDKPVNNKPVNNNTLFIIIMILGVLPLILWLISIIKIRSSESSGFIFVASVILELRFGIKYILLLLCLTLLINIPIMIYNYQKYKSDEHIEEWVNITSIILEVILLILHIYVTFSSFIAPSFK